MELFQNAAEELAKDYHCFLEYLDINEVQLSKRTGHIGKKDCFALNNIFHIVSENYQSCSRTQDYYTVIDFFYFFSMRSGVLQVVKKKGKGTTTQKTEKYHIFSQKSLLEQYILMMAVWLGEYQEALSDAFSIFNSNRMFDMINDAEAGAALSESFGGRKPVFWESFYIPETVSLPYFN